MRFIAVSKFSQRKKADVLILPFWQREKSSPEKAFSAPLVAKEILSSGDFHGKEGEVLLSYTTKEKEKRILLLGLGKKKKAALDTLRRAYASAMQHLLSKKCSRANIILPEDILADEEVVTSICEGMLLANYRYTKLKKDTLQEKPLYLLKQVSLVGANRKALTWASKARKLIQAVYFTRDLVNENSDAKPPSYMATVAKNFEKEFANVKTKIFDAKRIKKEKMGLILAVSQGSHLDPNLLFIEYQGNPSSKERIALVGKGVIYDTGGLNLKPSGMETMKADMGGAATVLGIMAAAASLQIKKNLVAVIPCVENAISSKSYKPGDVYSSYSGKMVEITNTDAEGRLILADAISYTLDKIKPDYIFDFATLTGGVIVALGDNITGYFTLDKKLPTKIQQASEETGDYAWQLPMHLPYRKLLHSDIADIANSGGRAAHAMQGALFLHSFFGKNKTPWVHFDIAGPAFLNKPSGYNPKYGTGAAVRLAISLLEKLSDSDK